MSKVILMHVYLENGQGSSNHYARIPFDFSASLRRSYNLFQHIFMGDRGEEFALLYSSSSIDVNAIDGMFYRLSLKLEC